MSHSTSRRCQEQHQPYCSEYWEMVAEQDIERLRALEKADEDIASAAEYHARYDGASPPNEYAVPIELDEFESIFNQSKYVY